MKSTWINKDHSKHPATFYTRCLSMYSRLLCLHFPSPRSPGIIYISKIINRKRGNYILDRVASLPLAHLPRPLTLQEYFSFHLSPQCHKHSTDNLSLSSSHKNYPPYFSKSWQISTFDHFFLQLCLSLSWLQTHEQFRMVHGGLSFLACW